MKTRPVLILMIALASLAVFNSSCKKEDTKKSPDLIVGKWNVVTSSTKTYDSMGNVIDSHINNITGQYIEDFRENGMVIFTYHHPSEPQYDNYDTANYSNFRMSLKVTDHPVLGPITFILQSLTTTDLQYYVRWKNQNDVTGAVNEYSISLKRQ